MNETFFIYVHSNLKIGGVRNDFRREPTNIVRLISCLVERNHLVSVVLAETGRFISLDVHAGLVYNINFGSIRA